MCVVVAVVALPCNDIDKADNSRVGVGVADGELPEDLQQCRRVEVNVHCTVVLAGPLVQQLLAQSARWMISRWMLHENDRANLKLG